MSVLLLVILIILIIALIYTLYTWITNKSLFGGLITVPQHGRKQQWDNIMLSIEPLAPTDDKHNFEYGWSLIKQHSKSPKPFSESGLDPITFKLTFPPELPIEKYTINNESKQILADIFYNARDAISRLISDNKDIYAQLSKLSKDDNQIQMIINIYDQKLQPNNEKISTFHEMLYKFKNIDTVSGMPNGAFNQIVNRYLSRPPVPINSPQQTELYNELCYYENICLSLKNMLKPKYEKMNLITKVKTGGKSVLSVGDVHGNLDATLNNLMKYMHILTFDPDCILVFTGDYIDRGDTITNHDDSLSVIMLLFELKVLFPNRIYLLRGNHDDGWTGLMNDFNYSCLKECIANRYRFIGEYYQIRLYLMISSVFIYLPLILLVDDDKLFVHGFIPREFKNSNVINNNYQIPSADCLFAVPETYIATHTTWDDYPANGYRMDDWFKIAENEYKDNIKKEADRIRDIEHKEEYEKRKAKHEEIINKLKEDYEKSKANAIAALEATQDPAEKQRIINDFNRRHPAEKREFVYKTNVENEDWNRFNAHVDNITKQRARPNVPMRIIPANAFGLDDLKEFSKANPSIKYITKGHAHSDTFNALKGSPITINVCVSSPSLFYDTRDYTNAEMNSRLYSLINYEQYRHHSHSNSVLDIPSVQDYADENPSWDKNRPAINVSEGKPAVRDIYAHAIYYYSPNVKDKLMSMFPNFDPSVGYIKITNDYSEEAYYFYRKNENTLQIWNNVYRKGIISILLLLDKNIMVDENIFNDEFKQKWTWRFGNFGIRNLATESITLHDARTYDPDYIPPQYNRELFTNDSYYTLLPSPEHTTEDMAKMGYEDVLSRKQGLIDKWNTDKKEYINRELTRFEGLYNKGIEYFKNEVKTGHVRSKVNSVIEAYQLIEKVIENKATDLLKEILITNTITPAKERINEYLATIQPVLDALELGSEQINNQPLEVVINDADNAATKVRVIVSALGEPPKACNTIDEVGANAYNIKSYLSIKKNYEDSDKKQKMEQAINAIDKLLNLSQTTKESIVRRLSSGSKIRGFINTVGFGLMFPYAAEKEELGKSNSSQLSEEEITQKFREFIKDGKIKDQMNKLMAYVNVMLPGLENDVRRNLNSAMFRPDCEEGLYSAMSQLKVIIPDMNSQLQPTADIVFGFGELTEPPAFTLNSRPAQYKQLYNEISQLIVSQTSDENGMWDLYVKYGPALRDKLLEKAKNASETEKQEIDRKIKQLTKFSVKAGIIFMLQKRVRDMSEACRVKQARSIRRW